MSNALSFILARLKERTTQVMLLTVVCCGVIDTGLVTMTQFTAWTTQLVAMLGLIGPVVAMLTPEAGSTVTTGAAADALIKAAGDAVQAKVPGAEQVQADIASVLTAAQPVLTATGAVYSTIAAEAAAAPVAAPAAAPVASAASK